MNVFAVSYRSLAAAVLVCGATAAGAQQMVTARVLSSAPVWEAVPVQAVRLEATPRRPVWARWWGR